MRDVALRTDDSAVVSLIAHPDPDGCCLTVRPSTNTLPAFIADDPIIQSIQQVHRRMVVPKTSFLRRRRRPRQGHSRHDFLARLASSSRSASLTMASTKRGGARLHALPLLGGASTSHSAAANGTACRAISPNIPTAKARTAAPTAPLRRPAMARGSDRRRCPGTTMLVSWTRCDPAVVERGAVDEPAVDGIDRQPQGMIEGLRPQEGTGGSGCHG